MPPLQPAAQPVPPQPAAPAERRKRLTHVARMAVLEWIRRVWHRLPPSKCIPTGGDVGTEADRLVEQWDCIANRQVLCRVCLLYKRCIDRDALIISACLDDPEDLRDVVLIQVGDMNVIARRALDDLRTSPICQEGLSHLQFRQAILTIATTTSLRDKLMQFAQQLLTCWANAFPSSYATKECQVHGNETHFAKMRLAIRERLRQRFSITPPLDDVDMFGPMVFNLPNGYQRDTITPLADAVRALVPSVTWEGTNYAAESVMFRAEEILFTAFCRSLGYTADAAAPVATYKLYPPSSRTAQTLYYIAGFIVHKIIKPSFKRVDMRNFIIRRNLMHALFWGMECAQHRQGGDRMTNAQAAREAGVPPDLVEATVSKRRAGPHGKELPAVFPTMPVYRLVTLLEANFRKCMTVGALCASPEAMAELEETLLSDQLVLQEFRQTLQPVTTAGRLATATRDDNEVGRALLQDLDLSDAELVAAVSDFEANDGGGGEGEGAAGRTGFSLDERDRGGDEILKAILRVFFNVRGRDLVRALMARRDVYQHEASSVSLRGSIAVVSQRLRGKLKALEAKSATPYSALHHADPSATNVTDDGGVPDKTLDAIDHIMAEMDVDEVTRRLCGLGSADPDTDGLEEC